MRTVELYKYNPRQCSDDEIERTFVAREGILCSVLGDLARRADASTNQHLLIIGPRGIGKTNFLIMIRLRVEAGDTLSRAYFPVQTEEEEYSVVSLADFFAQVLSLVADASSDAQLRESARRVADIEADEDAAETAIGALRAYSQRSGKKILLLVDNLDLILGDQIRDKAQLGRLRDILMNESFLVLIGASPTHFEEASGYDRPFYNFFEVIRLEDLSLEQMVDLLRTRAAWDGNEALLGKMKDCEPRLRALYHLTGGSPRLVLMLYQFCTQTALPEVRAALQMMLDDLTPYDKARLESLSPQQRKVVDTFARLGAPTTPTELAPEVGLGVNQTNSVLDRLRDLGFVERAPQERRKTTLYIVSERLFRIWHQMRFSRSSRRKLGFLIDFIRLWYAPEEWREESARLSERYHQLAAEERFEEAGRFVEHLEYMAAAAPQARWGADLADNTLWDCIESGDLERADHMLLERVEEQQLEEDPGRAAYTCYLSAYLADRRGNRVAEMAALENALEAQPEFPEALNALGCALATSGRLERDAGNRDAARQLFERSFEKYGLALSIKEDNHEAANNWGNALSDAACLERDAGDLEAARQLFERSFERYGLALSIKEDMHEAAYNWGNALAATAGLERDAGDLEAARQLFERSFEKYGLVLSIKEDKHEAAYNWGIALFQAARLECDAGDLEAARELFEASFEKYGLALSIKEDEHEAANNWAAALVGLARITQGENRDRLLGDALDKVNLALRIVEAAGGGAKIEFYSAHLVHIALRRAALAVEQDNLGLAREQFALALERVRAAPEDRVRADLLAFFADVVSRATAGFCAQLLETMRARGMDQELAFLEPIAKAIEYWQKGEDAEVLDRLNPEVRELVESIIARSEELPE